VNWNERQWSAAGWRERHFPHADLYEANLAGADLRGADLQGADLCRADLHGANLEDAEMVGADLAGADLVEADLAGANLAAADLNGAVLTGANLQAANLGRTDLRGADLTGVNLQNADLREANLRQADLRGADLSGADLAGADLQGAMLPGGAGAPPGGGCEREFAGSHRQLRPGKPRGAPSRCVLIVEDNPDGRETLRVLLTLLGFDVEVAADGLEGVRKGLELRPQAAVVDIGLPEMDGYQVGRSLRHALGRSVLLIAHTAYSGPSGRERAQQAGFDSLLSKPADIEELVRLLRGAEDRRESNTAPPECA